MPRDPENYSSHDYEDEETEYEVDWTTYDQSLRHAEIHLAASSTTANRASMTCSSASRPRTPWNTP